jgi:hypothetical protein
LAFVKCTYGTCSMLLKILYIALYTSPLSVQACRADDAYLTYLMLQQQLSQLKGSELDHRQVKH